MTAHGPALGRAERGTLASMDVVVRMRDAARRLTVELALLGALAVVFTSFPDDAPASGWGAAAPVLAFLGHVILGLAVLVDAATLVVTGARTASSSHVYLPAMGLASAAVAVVGGAVSWLTDVPVDVRPAMVVGWLVATGASAGSGGRPSSRDESPRRRATGTRADGVAGPYRRGPLVLPVRSGRRDRRVHQTSEEEPWDPSSTCRTTGAT